MATKECQMCSEFVKYTKVLRCPNCSTNICIQCIVDHIARENTHIIKCPMQDCKYVWDTSFLIRTLPTIVLKHQKNTRQKLLFEREKDLLSDTSHYVSLMNDKKKTVNEIIEAKKNQDKDLLVLLRSRMQELNKHIDEMYAFFDGKNIVETDHINLPVVDESYVDTVNVIPYKKLTSYEALYPTVMTKDTRNFLWYRFNVVIELKKNLIKLMDGYNLDLRVKYLNKRIDEDKWKVLLFKRDKDIILHSEFNKIKNTYVRTIGGALDLVLKHSLPEETLSECIRYITNFHHFMMDDYFKLIRTLQSKRRCFFLHPVELKKRYKPPPSSQ
jgi:hypothetical protein